MNVFASAFGQGAVLQRVLKRFPAAALLFLTPSSMQIKASSNRLQGPKPGSATKIAFLLGPSCFFVAPNRVILSRTPPAGPAPARARGSAPAAGRAPTLRRASPRRLGENFWGRTTIFVGFHTELSPKRWSFPQKEGFPPKGVVSSPKGVFFSRHSLQCFQVSGVLPGCHKRKVFQNPPVSFHDCLRGG